MIEVLFNESEAASMRAAKSTILHSRTDGPTSVWMAGKKPPAKKPSGWVEGTAEEVICLRYMLDIGDIQKDVDSQYRKDLIASLYSPWTAAEAQDFGNRYLQLNELTACLQAGESIRAWVSDAPYSLCGWYHLCSIMDKYDNPLSIVKLPEYVVRDKTIVLHKNWGMVAADEFAGFLHAQKALSKEEVHLYALLWRELAAENCPLRAVINGTLTGVPEDFYDFMIFSRITKKPVKECRLIGDLLGCYQVSIGDWWYGRRIQHYIEQGRIQVVEDAERAYARLICLA